MTCKPFARIFKLFWILLLAAVFLLPAGADDVTPEIPIGTEVVTSVSIKTLPNKKVYFVGEDLVIDGATLLVRYNSGREDTVNVLPGWCSEFESYTDGSVEITVQYPYGGDPVSFTVTVVRPEVSKITITNLPEKLTYYTGDEFDSSGLTVMATQTNGETTDVTNEITFSGFSSDSPATGKKITCSYVSGSKKFTATFKIDVILLEAVRLEVRKMPSRVEYYDGEQFDITGIVVGIVYNDGHEETVSDVSEITAEGYNPMQLGDQYVTISCRGKSAVISVRTVRSEIHVHTPGEFVVDREPTCTEPGRRHANCLVCGEIVPDIDSEIPALGHSFGEWITVAEPTGVVEGARDRVCSVCGFTERETIPRLSDTATSGASRAVREIGLYFPQDASFELVSVLQTTPAARIDEYRALVTDRECEICDVFHVSFYADGQRLPVHGVTTYTIAAPEGNYQGFRVIIGNQVIKAVWDRENGTLSFPTEAASGEEGFQAALAGILPDAATTAETTVSGPDITTAPGEDETSAEPGQTQAAETTDDPDRGEKVASIGKTVRNIAFVLVGIIVLAFGITMAKKYLA